MFSLLHYGFLPPFHIKDFLLWENIIFTILAIFKCAVQGHKVHSHCCVTVTTISPQNFSLFLS